MTGPEDGVGSFLIGLATGLSGGSDAEEFLFLTFPGRDVWLREYLGAGCRTVSVHEPIWKGFARRRLPIVVSARQRLGQLGVAAPANVPVSDGSLELEGVEVVHLTSQAGFLTEVPTIYHPHDLLHLHFPEYFSPRVIEQRELFYRTLCDRATVVVVASNWTKSDIVHHYGLAPEKIQVVPLAPLLSEYPEPTAADLARTALRHQLPDGGFVFYPAQTWPHKNHLMLLEGLAQLKREGMRVPFVSSGRKTPFFARIEIRAQQLGVDDQIQFLEFVSPLELQCLYRLSRCVVIPTKFEAASFPLWEAFLAGTPAACSSVTSLPEQAGGAALLFDPDQPEAIAASIRSLMTDEDLRRQLVTRGHANVSQLNWRRTGDVFRTLYRKVSGRPVGVEDLAILAAADGFL